MKATLTELHRDTAKLVRPVIHGGQPLVITNRGKAVAKIVRLPTHANRLRALEILRKMGPLNLPGRK